MNNHVQPELSPANTAHTENLMEPLVLSINETAKALGIGRSSVYALIKSGSLDAIKIGTRTLLTTESIRRLTQSGTAN